MKRADRLPGTMRAMRGVALGAVTAAAGSSAHVAGGGALPGTRAMLAGHVRSRRGPPLLG